MKKNYGIKSLKESVLNDTKRGENCFNENGCDHEFTRRVPVTDPALLKMGFKESCISVCKCTHKYCDRYKEIIDRAKHYSEVFETDYKRILTHWETKRSYWYMNYYSDNCSSFPKIDTSNKNLLILQNREEFQKYCEGKGFLCPKCEKVSIDPQECSQPDCDWKSYGLLGCLGKGIKLLLKEDFSIRSIFKPIVMIEKENGEKKENV